MKMHNLFKVLLHYFHEQHICIKIYMLYVSILSTSKDLSLMSISKYCITQQIFNHFDIFVNIIY